MSRSVLSLTRTLFPSAAPKSSSFTTHYSLYLGRGQGSWRLMSRNMSSEAAQDAPKDVTEKTPDNAEHNAHADVRPRAPDAEPGAGDPEKPMSKNALKRLLREQKWEASKGERRQRRKEKRHELKDRRREHRAELIAQGVDPQAGNVWKPAPVLVPVALVLDCDFEEYMTDKERVSLASQVTRSYSENRQARYQSHLWVAGWRGGIAKRFRTVLAGQHRNWKGIDFVKGDFVECAELARARMREDGDGGGGKMVEALQRSLDEPVSWTRDETDPFPLPGPEPEPAEAHSNIIYLTADSPYTLQRLEPHATYIVGGLVDKNREKGLCYRRARARGIRTARLPIGQFLAMQSRKVLTTNHVVEIMLRWLEHGDWGRAFLDVIPKRKGGKLIGEADAESPDDEDEDELVEDTEAVEELADAAEPVPANACDDLKSEPTAKS